MWSNSEYIWPNAQHNLPNACAFHKMRSNLAIVGKFDQMRTAQCIWANAQRNWPNAQCKRCAFGQMLCISSVGDMRCAFGQMRRLVKCALHIFLKLPDYKYRHRL